MKNKEDHPGAKRAKTVVPPGTEKGSVRGAGKRRAVKKKKKTAE